MTAKRKTTGAKTNGNADAVLRPRATHAGQLWGRVDCNVLEDGTPLITQRGMLRGLRGETRGPEKGDLGRYLARLPNDCAGLTRGPEPVDFDVPQPHGGVVTAKGYRPEFFVGVLRAYVESYQAGKLRASQEPMAKRAMGLLCLLAGKAVETMIYEACGYHRPDGPASAIDPAYLQAFGEKVALAAVQRVEILLRQEREQTRSEMETLRAELRNANGKIEEARMEIASVNGVVRPYTDHPERFAPYGDLRDARKQAEELRKEIAAVAARHRVKFATVEGKIRREFSVAGYLRLREAQLGRLSAFLKQMLVDGLPRVAATPKPPPANTNSGQRSFPFEVIDGGKPRTA